MSKKIQTKKVARVVGSKVTPRPRATASRASLIAWLTKKARANRALIHPPGTRGAHPFEQGYWLGEAHACEETIRHLKDGRSR